MTRLHDVSIGKFDQFKRLLAEAGLSSEMINTVLRQPELADGMVDWLREQLSPPEKDLFSYPEQMLDSLESRVSERDWPITAEQLDILAAEMPEAPLGRLVGLSFDIWLGNLQTTFEELWQWVVDVHPKCDEGIISESDKLFLVDPDRYDATPSIDWVVVDFGANWNKDIGIRPADVNDSESLAGLELLSAFAVHPTYPPSIDGTTVPSVWLPGLQYSKPGDEDYFNVPVLDWYPAHGEVILFSDKDICSMTEASLPVRKKL